MFEDESRLEWWVKSIICPVLLLALSIFAIVQKGVFGSPSSFILSLGGILAIYVIYGSVREELKDQKGEGDGELTLEEVLEPWKADSSVEAVIYRWMTIAFVVIVALLEQLKSERAGLTIMLFAAIVILIRTGGEGVPDDAVTNWKRIGALFAGIASGVVLGLAGRLLVSALLG
jgi:hypothetical protein